MTAIAPTRQVSSAPLVLRLESRGSCELNLADLVVNGRVEVFPHIERKGLLYLQFRKSQVTLSAGPYVGLIPLTPGIMVEVQPKLPVGNLARVLDIARAPLDSLANVDRFYSAENVTSSSILEFIAVNFSDAIRRIAEKGFHKAYLEISEASSRPRGRIDMIGTVRSCWSRGNRHQLRTHRFEQTANLAINRVIKGALELVLEKSRNWFAETTGVVRSANALYRQLPNDIGRIRADDLLISRKVSERRALPQARSYYYRALEIAQLLLSGRSVSLEAEGHDVVLGTYIVNFENLFEAYLRRALSQRCGASFWVRDGNMEGRKPLFDDRKNPPAQPDIVIVEQATRRKLIAEVKYKDQPNRDDINQAITYALSYRAKHAVLIHQMRPGSPGGLRRLGLINGIELSAYAYDLTRADLELEEDKLTEQLLGLLQAA